MADLGDLEECKEWIGSGPQDPGSNTEVLDSPSLKMQPLTSYGYMPKRGLTICVHTVHVAKNVLALIRSRAIPKVRIHND